MSGMRHYTGWQKLIGEHVLPAGLRQGHTVLRQPGGELRRAIRLPELMGRHKHRARAKPAATPVGRGCRVRRHPTPGHDIKLHKVMEWSCVRVTPVQVIGIPSQVSRSEGERLVVSAAGDFRDNRFQLLEQLFTRLVNGRQIRFRVEPRWMGGH